MEENILDNKKLSSDINESSIRPTHLDEYIGQQQKFIKELQEYFQGMESSLTFLSHKV